MDTAPSSPTSSDTPKWVLPAAAVIAVAALIVAFVVFTSSGSTDDDAADSALPATEVSVRPTDVSTSTPTTDDSTTTSDPAISTTSEVATTTTLAPDSTTVDGDPAPTFTAELLYGDGSTVTLDLIGVQSGLTVYDGLIEAPALRCVALLAPGIDGWNEWCGAPDSPVRFLTEDGTTMWLVELGAAVGEVTVSVPRSDWTLTSNGCSGPVADLLQAAIHGPTVMTSAFCVPGEAFVGNSTVLLQPGSPDGGGAVVSQAADGSWTSQGGGTSFPCDDAVADGNDRCPVYGLDVGDELFDALLPIPPIGGASATAEVVGMRDATVDVQAVIGAATSSADIGAAVAAAFRDGTDEPTPTVETFGGFGGWNLELVVVTIPAFDDSVLSTTYGIWVRTDPATPVQRAFAFETCARGLAGGGLCI